jgi:hypothetical protein
MGMWFAPATDPLGRQESFLAQQPQHPFPAHPDAMLAAQPRPELAVPSPANGEACSTRRISLSRSGSLTEVPGPLRQRDRQPPYLCRDPRSTGIGCLM